MENTPHQTTRLARHHPSTAWGDVFSDKEHVTLLTDQATWREHLTPSFGEFVAAKSDSVNAHHRSKSPIAIRNKPCDSKDDRSKASLIMNEL